MSAGIWMKIVLLRKEDLPSEGRVIEQIYALARIIKGYKSKNSAKFFFETKRFRLSPSSEFQDTIDD